MVTGGETDLENEINCAAGMETDTEGLELAAFDATAEPVAMVPLVFGIDATAGPAAVVPLVFVIASMLFAALSVIYAFRVRIVPMLGRFGRRSGFAPFVETAQWTARVDAPGLPF